LDQEEVMNIGSTAFALVLLAAAGCAVEEGGELDEPLASDVIITGEPATAALKCKNVGGRWQICGDASRTKLVAGVGIRFFKPGPNNTMVAASATHPSCDAALADTSVPTVVRNDSTALCGDVFAKTVAEFPGPLPTLVDERGSPVLYGELSGQMRAVVDRAVGDLVAREPGVQALGCGFGPGIGVSCWGGGYMCAAGVDEDGVHGGCWKCEIADCD
jgi:hypothetical protein